MPYDQLEGYVPHSDAGENSDDGASAARITHGTRLWALISIIVSAVGIALVFVPYVGVFFGAVGIGFSVISRRKNGYFYRMAIIGIIIGVVAVASCTFFIIYNALTEAGLTVNLFDLLLR